MKSYKIRMDPKPMTGVLVRRGRFGYRHMHRGKTTWGDTQ